VPARPKLTGRDKALWTGPERQVGAFRGRRAMQKWGRGVIGQWGVGKRGRVLMKQDFDHTLDEGAESLEMHFGQAFSSPCARARTNIFCVLGSHANASI